MNPRFFLTAAAAGIVCARALAATPPAPVAKPAARPAVAAPAGPWAKVPALPTACYSSQDTWWDKNNAALDAVQKDHDRQNDANAVVEKRLNDAMSANPMAMAQAMQQAMMSDPQNAQKYMERMVQQGQQAQTEVVEQTDKEKQLDAESAALVKQYKAALAKSSGTADARWAALRKKEGYASDAYGPSETGTSDRVWAEWHAILKDRDAAYAANCAQWFGANGRFHAYMNRYKDYLVQERIPHHKRLMDEPRLDNFRLLKVPAAGWRTTTDYEAAEDYMRKASQVFGERQADPQCRKETYCQ